MKAGPAWTMAFLNRSRAAAVSLTIALSKAGNLHDASTHFFLYIHALIPCDLTAMTEPRVIIIGAGITGLLLAQSLKSHNIAFDIYERDLGADSRGQGWGLAIHWALDTLRSLLPNDLRERLPETYVDPSLKQGEGKFPLHRLDNGEVLFTNLSPKRVRVSRERLRALLMSGLEIKVRT